MTAPPTDPFDLSGFLPYRMTVAAERLSAGLARRYRSEFGLSVAEWRVLVHVADAGAVSIREIHQRVHLEKSTASRAASRLQDNGYLSKTVNDGDRRLVVLRLTEAGEALMAQLLPLAQAYQRQIEALLMPHLKPLEAALDLLTRSEDLPD